MKHTPGQIYSTAIMITTFDAVTNEINNLDTCFLIIMIINNTSLRYCQGTFINFTVRNSVKWLNIYNNCSVV